DGVDATRATLQQGKLRVGVSAVTLLTVEPPKKSKDPAKRYLVVRLRVERTAGGSEFAADQWVEYRPGAGKPPVRVTDSAGRALSPSALDLGRDGSGQPEKSRLFPVAATDPVYVFDAPAAADDLWLAVPADAWGGTATFRFTVPRSMIRAESRAAKN